MVYIWYYGAKQPIMNLQITRQFADGAKENTAHRLPLSAHFPSSLLFPRVEEFEEGFYSPPPEPKKEAKVIPLWEKLFKKIF